jgi:MFS family permease
MNTQLSHAEAEERNSSRSDKSFPVKTFVDHRKVINILSVCMALQMTSFVIILPLFAQRFSELGAGVELLGLSAMAYALSAMLTAPFMGALADRLGRRRLVLASLSIYILAFIGYRFAASPDAIILIRGLAGAFTAGLIPAVNGIVADLAPVDRRAQWIGIVNGGASIGWIAGPVLGGVLFDRWGYAMALNVSILMALIAFLTAFFKVPETHKRITQGVHGSHRNKSFGLLSWKSFWHTFRNTLPGPLPLFFALLFISFAVMFAWAFIEPRFMFYAYDDLHWSASMLGMVMSTYGIAMAIGEFGLSRSSDRLGRKPVIIFGMLLFTAQFIGLAVFQNYLWIAVCFILAGLGNAIYDPALNASILDIAPVEYQARNLGIKSTAASLGNILGPALVVLVNPYLDPKGIFLAAIVTVCLSILLLFLVPFQQRSISLQDPGIKRESTLNDKITS